MNTTTSPSRSKRQFNLRRFLLGLVMWYGIIMVLFYCVQEKLLYRPVKLTPAQFEAQVEKRLLGRATILSKFDAVIIEPSLPASRTAILYHGNGGNGIDRYILQNEFLQRGYRLILAEYPGYAARPGSSSETTLIPDAKQLYTEVVRKFPNEPVVLVGESLGSAIATQVAATGDKPPALLVLITPFAKMADVGAKQLPMYPVGMLLRDKYESARSLPGYRGEVRIMVADEDELVGAKSGLDLYQAAKDRGPASLLRLPATGHNTWLFKLTPEQWDQLLGPRIPRP